MAEHETTVLVEESGDARYLQHVTAGTHGFAADEPESLGGKDKGPAPYDFLLAALGSCTSITVRMYADQKKWPLEKISVRLTHRKETGADGKKTDIITRAITVTGPLDDAQRQRLLEIANKCPVHRTLENHPVIESRLA
jgi:uncharacterized OsmC-like protein